MASWSWKPILVEIQAFLLAYEVDGEKAFDDNVYLGGVNGNPINPFVVLQWAPNGSTGTDLPQNNLMVDSNETTTINIYYTVENGDGTNVVTQELQDRVGDAQEEMETALNSWLYNKIPVEIDPIDNPGVYTDWNKKIYACTIVNAVPMTKQFTSDAEISTAVAFTISFKYNDNNAI